MELAELQTPAFIVDLAVASRNCERMREKAKRLGVALRPHVKTHKTLEGARLQLAAESGPITVSTLAEAEFFAHRGFRDITYAVPIAPGKLGRVSSLASRIDVLSLVVDHAATLDAVESEGRQSGVCLDVFLEVDCGYHRTGVDPDAEASLPLARRIAESRFTRLRGLLTHAGHSYHARSREGILTAGRDEIAALTRFRELLSREGIEVPVSSVGSTPTASAADSFAGADEIRPGNYIFFDAFQAALGSCSTDDIAASVLATIIGVYPERGEVVVDAGALALSKDRGMDRPGHADYGVVCDLVGTPIEGCRVVDLSQEHGRIETGETAIDRFQPGDRVRILPNHSCLAAALFDVYYVIEGAEIVDRWVPVRGW